MNIIDNEKIYTNSKLPITYLFVPASNIKSDKLIIIFSAFSSINRPEYNYIATFSNVNVNRLYILDNYGERGSYYLGCINNFDVEKSVYSLITYILQQYNIDKQNVVCVGSSKGGFAALYYGIKYEFGYVISGEPQIYVAKYLQDFNIKEVLNYITGGVKKIIL